MKIKDFFKLLSVGVEEFGLLKGTSLSLSQVLSTSTKAFLGIGTAISVVSTAYSIYQQQQEELIRNTQKAASTFDESNNSIQEQINKYKELKSQLSSGELTSSEEYEVKKQILDIQNQLVSSYGSQANGIDLVNGSLEKELALMNELSVANANTYLNENEKGITKATKEMNAERYYSFGSIELNEDNKSLISDLQDIAKEIDGIDLNANSGNGNMFVEFRGDTVKAKDSIDEYMTRVRQLKSEMEANGQDTSALDTLLQQASGELAKNQEILDNYQEIYNKSLQADMISKGFGSDKPATIYNDYAKAIQEYNDALLSSDDSKIADAKMKFDEVKSSVDGVIEKYPEYTSLFDEVGSALDTASIKANDFNKYLSSVLFSNAEEETIDNLKSKYQEAIDKRKELYSGSNYVGNVDINNRPVVINGDGSYSTTSTSFQEKWIGDEETGSYKIIHFTPILPDGTVLDDNSLNDYIDSLFNSEDILEADKIENGGKGIVYKVDTEVNGEKITDKNLEDAFGIADAWDVDMHNLQDKMYKDEAKIKASLEQIRNDIDIQEVFKDLKDVDLKSMNFDDDVTSDSEDALAKIVDKAIELGIVSDDSSESIAEVVDILVQLGYVSSDSSSGIEKVTQIMAYLTEKTQGVVNDINAVMGVLSGQQTGKSISLADFNSDELKDYRSALEYVNGSMQLNAEKVQEITKAKADETIAINENNKALKQAEYLKNAGEIEELRSELRGLTEGTQEYNDVEMRLQSLMSSNEAISAECDQYDLLTATIKEATSAYNNWLIAQSGGDYGDMFNDSLDAYARIMNTYNSKSDIYGDFGSKKFDAAVDFIVPDTVDTEDADAIKSYMDSFKQYLTFDNNGKATGMNIEQFCKNAMDKGLMVLDEAGENYQIAGETTMEDFANGLNMSLPMVQAFFDELQLKGGEFDWADEAIKTVGDLGVKAYESAEALRSIEGNSDLEIKMDVSGMDNLDDKLSTLDGTIQQMNELKAQPDVDASQIEYANDIIQYCVAQKQKLSEPVFMTIDTSQVDGELGEVIGLIQQLQSAKNELDIQASVGADTTEAQGKVDNLVAQIQSKDATIKAKIGDVDTSNVDTILAGISEKSAQAWVTLGVKDEAIAGYVPENKTATVTYKLDSYAVDSYNPKNLRRTVTYTVVTKGNPPKVNGTAHTEGTAHISGTVRNNSIIGKALASGEWGVNKDETALVGELGQELIVYGNKYWTVGDNGAEFTAIPKGAIVFNHKQTEEIFKNGYVTSGGGRGHAYASGTAYVSGGISVSNVKKSYGSKTTKASTTKKASTSTTKASQAVTEATENLVDFIEILLTRTKELTKKLTDAIENAVSLSDKMSKNSSALSQIQKEISVNQQAYNKYIAQANAVGLAEGYASQIRNGSLNIENITDENLKKKIDQYKEYYDKAVSVQEAVRDLQKEEKQLALDRLDYIEDWYDALISLNDAYKDVNDTHLEYLEKIGSSAITDNIKGYYQDSYDKEYDSYGKALRQLSDYTQEVNELLANGYLQEGSEDYLEAMKIIQEFTKQVDESAIALVELEDKIREIDYTKLQQLIDGSDRRTDQLKNAQALAEARDEQIGRDALQKQIDSLNNSINSNYALREKKLQEQALYDVTSTRYQELAEEIAELDNEIYDDLIDIEDLKNQVFEAEFFNYEKEQENLEYFIGELDDFASLLNEDAFFTKDGAFTDEAYAKIALTADAMSKCKQQIANATEALNKLDEMYQNGLISEEEYSEKQKELLNTVRENTLAVNDYKNELIDLYKKQMEKENEALKKNIDLRKRALQAQKDYWDYADTINSKTKDVDALKAQIAALDGVTSSAGLARKKQLEAELANAEKDLSDTKRNHQYDMMQDGYDQMSENLDESLEDLEYSIATSSEKQLQVVQSMLNQMVASYQEAYGKINSIVNETGFVGTDSFNDTVNNTSTSSGTSSIVASATQSQSTVKPSNNVSNINSSNTSNTNTSAIESEIKKEPNTDNRLCAELTLSKSSVSVQEGSSTSVSASIRPNDAKNKSLSWTPKDASVVSVTSDGKITGLKPGSTTIVVSTTDGSNLRQTVSVTVTKKPNPPKPQAPKNNTTTQGNGVPDVGDKVTFVSGVYHEDSYGNGRWGNQGLGGSMYITKINPNSPYPIHLSTGSKLGSGDRGWLKRNQIKGYARGSKHINGKRWALTQEKGNETVKNNL